MRIIITNTSGKPIYEQIEEQIKEAILNDELINILEFIMEEKRYE